MKKPTTQPDLFTAIDAQERDERADLVQQGHWRICWNWRGPVQGGMVSFDELCATDTTGKGHYVYMAPARVVAIKGDITVVEFVGTCTPTALGCVFHLKPREIWPCLVRKLNQGHLSVVKSYADWLKHKGN
jgi:hypothetical protein